VESAPGYHEATVGFTEIAKTAALVENGAAQGLNAGTQANPVLGARGQQVEYTLMVTREASPQNVSGRIVVTDALPADMALMPGSIQGAVSGSGQVVSMRAAPVTDVDGGSKPGVEWILNGLRDGDIATLRFRATLPESADNPATPEIETHRGVSNIARLADEAIRDMKYARRTAGRAAGENVYAAEKYDKASNPTYHFILGQKLEATLRSSIPAGSRVFEGDVITYTIVVNNSGQDAATNVLVRNLVPRFAGFVPGSQTSSMSATFVSEGSVIGWIVPQLAVGESVTLTFQTRVTGMGELGVRGISDTAMFAECKIGADPRAELLSGAYLQRINTIEHYQRVGATIIAKKIDAETGAPLSGAEFVLQQLSAASARETIANMVAISDKNGEAIFEDVPRGRYSIHERKAPAGYTASPVRRSVVLDGDRATRSIVVPNNPANRPSAKTNGQNDADEGFLENWGTVLLMLDYMGVPNAGAGGRNVGDIPK